MMAVQDLRFRRHDVAPSCTCASQRRVGKAARPGDPRSSVIPHDVFSHPNCKHAVPAAQRHHVQHAFLPSSATYPTPVNDCAKLDFEAHVGNGLPTFGTGCGLVGLALFGESVVWALPFLGLDESVLGNGLLVWDGGGRARGRFRYFVETWVMA